jgi:hypothetical protein
MPRGFDRPQQGYERFGNGYAERGFSRPPARAPENYAYNHSAESPNRPYAGSYVRPALQNYTYNRPQLQQPIPARPQSYARQASPYGNPQRAWRAPASNYQRNDFAQRANLDPRSYSGGRSFAESAPKQERSGGFHMFGGNHGERSFHSSYKAPKMPKAPKTSGGGHHGGGHGGGSHHGR